MSVGAVVRARLGGLRSRVTTGVLWWRVRIRAFRARGSARLWLSRPDPGLRVGRGLRLLVRPGARFQLALERGVTVGPEVTLILGDGTLYLGPGCAIGPGAVIEADGVIVLRDGVRLGAGAIVSAGGGEVELHVGARVGDGAAVCGSTGARTVVPAGAEVAPGAVISVPENPPGRSPIGPPADADGPRVSVVVSTRDRRGRLPRLLEALARQTLPATDYEVVVVDNGSSDDTSSVLAAALPALPAAGRAIRLDGAAGPGRGRNAGWRAARSAVIAFTDDDCAPAPEWLEEGLAALERSGAGLVQGRTLPEPRELGRLGFLATSQRIEGESGRYETCNMLYRRAVLEAVGGFAEDIPVPAGEDTEAAWRARALGHDSAFAPAAVVYHAVRGNSFREYVRGFAAWAEVPRVLRRTPGTRGGWFLGLFWTPLHAGFLLALGGAGVALGLKAAGVAAWYAALAACVPYLAMLTQVHRESSSLPARVARAPARVAIEAVEVATLLRGSVRHRALLL